MRIVLNGEPKDLERAKDISGLLDEIGLPPATLLVEHNGLALHRDEWADHALAEGDQVEIIKIVAGG